MSSEASPVLTCIAVRIRLRTGRWRKEGGVNKRRSRCVTGVEIAAWNRTGRVGGLLVDEQMATVLWVRRTPPVVVTGLAEPFDGVFFSERRLGQDRCHPCLALPKTNQRRRLHWCLVRTFYPKS